MLNPRPKVIRADYIVVSFEELKLQSKRLPLHEIPIEKNFSNGVIGRNDSMVVHDRIAAGRHGVIEPSDLMQSRIYRVLQEWTNQPHARQPENIIATTAIAAAV